jgi:hypothetical protein
MYSGDAATARPYPHEWVSILKFCQPPADEAAVPVPASLDQSTNKSLELTAPEVESQQIAIEGLVAEVNWRLTPTRCESVQLVARNFVEDVAQFGFDDAVAGLRARRETDALVIDAMLDAVQAAL